jgi:hypothetical protein
VIFAIGLTSDGTLAHFVGEAARRAAAVTTIDLHDVVAGGDWRLAIPDDGRSWLTAAGQRYDLDADGSYFCRIVDLSSLENEDNQLRWQGLIAALTAWLDQAPGTVVNRPGVHSDNGCKPLHELNLNRHGFAVPESITSSDRDQLRAFAAVGPTIVKALSGVRADSRLVTRADFDSFDTVQGPVHLQRYIAGNDVRAHVCGSRVYSQEIISSAVDYRTAAEPQVTHAPCDLPDGLVARMIDCTRHSCLAFAGWDFKVSEDRQFWCLEANPMPGYDWYDRRLDGAISGGLVDLLTGATA